MEEVTYSRSLDLKELIDRIRDKEKFFDMKQIEDPKMVNMACIKLNGHAFLWWDSFQLDRPKKRKDKIKT